MQPVVGFDVYGTLVDPLAMREPLAGIVGAEQADQAAAIWRATQIDYAFRRALMDSYVDFTVCTRQALAHTFDRLGLDLTPDTAQQLLERYLHLPAYPGTLDGLRILKSRGLRMIAFSNGTRNAVRTVLDNAGLLAEFDDIVSVDDLRTYKPNPVVYRHLVERGGSTADETWLVSANAWDVIGAKSAGLRAAWLRRSIDARFDRWGYEPDLVVANLHALAIALAV